MTEDSNALEKEVGLIGYTCPRDGENYRFDHCFTQCKNHCEPLPILMAMSSKREVVEGRYSTTEILDPPQIVYLKRHFPYFVSPEQRVHVTFGTGWHYAMERQKYRIKEMGLEDEYIIENNGKPFEVEIETSQGTAILTGIPDLYHVSKKHLWDFKTMKYYYTVKNLLEGKGWGDSTYPWQVNIYRIYNFPETKRIFIEALIKDFKRNMMKLGVRPSMQFEVPIIRDELVEELVKAKLAYLLEIEKDPSKLRECTLEERWVSYNKRSDDYMKPIRCMDYCEPSTVCPQFQSKSDSEFEVPTKAEEIL